MTDDLGVLADWLAARAVTAVVMAATGVSWQPDSNVLERRGGLRLVVANAQHLKAVPGRKTAVTDAQWLAELLRQGLGQASFSPDRALRELTR